jgi:hypothetical protein
MGGIRVLMVSRSQSTSFYTSSFAKGFDEILVFMRPARLPLHSLASFA